MSYPFTIEDEIDVDVAAEQAWQAISEATASPGANFDRCARISDTSRKRGSGESGSDDLTVTVEALQTVIPAISQCSPRNLSSLRVRATLLGDIRPRGRIYKPLRRTRRMASEMCGKVL